MQKGGEGVKKACKNAYVINGRPLMNRVLQDGTSILWTHTGVEFLINQLVLDKDSLSFSFQVSQNCGSNECYIE